MCCRGGAPHDRPGGSPPSTEAWPDTLGRPATTQGNYGRNGNLEIVACAADYGLLVGWFNTEDEDDHSGAAVGRWSGALRFGGELRYVTSTITQVSHGPDYLEVLALTDGGSLRRLVWAPETGFVDQGAFAEDVTAHSAVHELVDGTLVAALVTGGRARLAHAYPGSGYPRLTLDMGPAQVGDAVQDIDLVEHGRHLDLLATDVDGCVRLWCDGVNSVVAEGIHAARLARSTGRTAVLLLDGTSAHVHDLRSNTRLDLGAAQAGAIAPSHLPDGTRWEVLLRDGGTIRHTRIRVGANAAESSLPVRAEVWVAQGTRTSHRPPESF